MGLVTRARGHLTMLSGGGTRPGCLWAQGKYGLTHFTMFAPSSPSSVIFHHILLYHRRHFNWRRHNVPTCLALLDPCSHSPVPIFHSLQSRARSWQSVDLGPPSNSAPSLSSTALRSWRIGFSALMPSQIFVLKVLLKILFTFLVAWERSGGNLGWSLIVKMPCFALPSSPVPDQPWPRLWCKKIYCANYQVYFGEQL